MTSAGMLLASLVALVSVDFGLAILFGRCMVPGLKCSACRRKK